MNASEARAKCETLREFGWPNQELGILYPSITGIVQSHSKETWKRLPRESPERQKLEKPGDNPGRIQRNSEESSSKTLEGKWGNYTNTLGDTEGTPHPYTQTTHSRVGTATLTHLTSLPDHVVSNTGQGSYIRNHYTDQPNFSPGLLCHNLSCGTGQSCYSSLTSHISMTRVFWYLTPFSLCTFNLVLNCNNQPWAPCSLLINYS